MSYDYNQLPHPGIRSLSPYIPGKSIEQVAQEQGLTEIIKLASNENALGCSDAVQKALHKLTKQQISIYPTSIDHPLRHKLAYQLYIETDMITLSNGSDMLFYLLLVCFALHNDKHIITHDYAFISYSIQAKGLGIPVVKTPCHSNWQVNIDAIINACTDKTALIFIANPNNPTGLYIPYAEIKRLLENIPETTILVLDEAYYEFAKHLNSENTIDLLFNHSNLVITRTFSKAFGLAGLRIGYAISNPQIAGLLYRMQLPFAVNQAAMMAVTAALDDVEFIEKTLQMTAQGIQQVQQGLDKLKLSYLNTAANFITVDCQSDGAPIYHALQQHGIIVRPLHPYNMNNYLRVTIGTEYQNQKYLEKLALCLEYINNSKKE